MKRCTLIMAGLLAVTAAAPVTAQTDELRQGVSIRMYDVGETIPVILPLVPGQTPNVSRFEERLDMDNPDFRPMRENFILIADGYIKAAQAGHYEFELTSDDGSQLWIEGSKIIDNDGLHGAQALPGGIDLEAGLHAYEIRYFNGPSDARLRLRWKAPGAQAFEVVPAEAYFCRAGEVRVTSPGVKQVIRPLTGGRPGDRAPLDGVHPSFTLTDIRPDDFRPRVGGMDMMPDGRLALCTWDPDGAVYLIENLGGRNGEARVKRIAAGLAEPLGLCVVDGDIYVLQKQELTRLIDHNGDDIIDEYQCVCSGWPVSPNFHEFAFGLVHAGDHFYANLAIAINPGGRSTWPQVPQRGSTIAISPNGTYEVVAHGLRTPNGIGFGVDGEIFLTDNQGDWLPVSKLLHLERGAFYGSRAVLGDEAADLDVTPPAAWLPQGEIGNSPSNPVRLDVGPYRNQMLHGDVTHGGLKRTFLEKVDGHYQGAVFRFSQGFEAGVNRTLWAGGGRYYVGGIGSTGNWGQEGKKRYGLQRLDFNSTPTFEMLAIRALENGLEIEFTTPLGSDVGWVPEQVRVEQYRYLPTADYGGPKLDTEQLQPKSTTVDAGRRKVFVEVDGIKTDRVVYVRLVGPWHDEDNRTLWSTEGWYTMNAIPRGRRGVARPAPQQPQNVLTAAQKAEGWTLLFDGRTLKNWHGYRRDNTDGWAVREGALCRVGPGGDIATDEEYENFELSLEWKVSPGGNSGIFFNVSEDGAYPWSSGPEMQVLDNERHYDGQNPLTSAGANYALYAPPFDASYPAGVYNQARLRVKDGHVEHWLNGEKIVEYDLWSDEWKARVAASKFASMPDYGRHHKGHIALQDHGDLVSFRNIMIRRLD
ncbi:MAG: DUF1080 domain-containing protein [Phycisphaerales bacterium]|nr:DUF1080 domain-containing protein [Phycisphaerales bacterium]